MALRAAREPADGKVVGGNVSAAGSGSSPVKNRERGTETVGLRPSQGFVGEIAVPHPDSKMPMISSDFGLHLWCHVYPPAREGSSRRLHNTLQMLQVL